MNQQKAWLAPAKRALFLVTIKDRWISFAIHSAPLLLGAMFWILFVLASTHE